MNIFLILDGLTTILRNTRLILLLKLMIINLVGFNILFNLLDQIFSFGVLKDQDILFINRLTLCTLWMLVTFSCLLNIDEYEVTIFSLHLLLFFLISNSIDIDHSVWFSFCLLLGIHRVYNFFAEELDCFYMLLIECISI